MHHRLPALIGLLMLCSQWGCSGFIYRQTGSTLSGYAQRHMVPWLMERQDVGLACATGTAVGPLIGSFERVTDPPDLAGLVAWVGGGMCAEASAWDAELAAIRAVKRGDAPAAQDARMVEERHHAVAARRFYVAWRYAEHHFMKGKGKLGAGKCPVVEEDEQVYLLLGAASGLLAVLHDRAASGSANVDVAVLPAAARVVGCLDNAKWWGVPRALQAAVWMTVPGSGPAKLKPREELEKTAAIGDAAGVRLARAMQVLALETADDAAAKAVAIKAHGTALEQKKAPAKWRLLDSYARRMTQQAVDRVWSRMKGHRGPTGSLALPEAESSKGDDEDDLDGLDEDEAAPKAGSSKAVGALKKHAGK